MQIPVHFQTANIFAGPDLIVVAVIAVFLFGGKKLPELAKGLGEGIKSFKEAVKERPQADGDATGGRAQEVGTALHTGRQQ